MQVFSTIPLRATIALKWETYARTLLLRELLLYSVMLGLFTAYCILKGYTETGKDKTLGWLGGGILVITMLMALWKLYRVMRQFWLLCSDCGSGFVRPLFYWFESGNEVRDYLMQEVLGAWQCIKIKYLVPGVFE